MPTVADELTEALALAECPHLWALGSAMVDGLLDRTRADARLTVHGMSSERDAVFAADGASRVSGRLGAAAFIGSVGLGVALVGVQTAVLEERPLLLIIGQTDPDAPTGGLQDTRATGSRDQDLVTATGCAAWEVKTPADLTAAWPGLVAALSDSRPAALLVAESCFGQSAAGPLAPLPSRAAGPRRSRATRSRAIGSTEIRTRAQLWRALAAADPGATVFADAGQSRHWGRHLVADGLDLRFEDCPRSASLGWAIPAALGAATQSGERTYAVCGDGGLLMSLAALADLGRHRADVTVLVAANGILGVDAARGAVVPDDLVVPEIDIVTVSEAMGVPARMITTQAEVGRACAEAAGPRLLVSHVPPFEDVAGGDA